MVRWFILPTADRFDERHPSMSQPAVARPAFKPGAWRQRHPDRDLLDAIRSLPCVFAQHVLLTEHQGWKPVHHSLRIWRIDSGWRCTDAVVRAEIIGRVGRSPGRVRLHPTAIVRTPREEGSWRLGQGQAAVFCRIIPLRLLASRRGRETRHTPS
jgi:hypothetical protein